MFDAAYFSQEDPILGVSESIISGMPIRIGTGFFDLIKKQDFDTTPSKYFERKLIFNDDELHEPFNYDVDPRYFQES